MSNELMDLKDQARLEFTQSTRERIANTLLAKGIPEATEDREFLMKALDGLDRNVIAKSKLKIDSKNQESAQDTVKLISNLLSRFNEPSTSTRSHTPLLDDDYVINDKVQDEDLIGLSTLNYEEFNKLNP